MYLLMTIGSLGDFIPFLALADRLRQRGHRVVLASNAGYAGMAQALGIPFAAIWDRGSQSLDALIAQNPDKAWDAVRDQMFVPAIRPAQDCIRHHAAERGLRVLACWTVFGARLARSEFDFPLFTFYLSPGALRQDAGSNQTDETCIGLYPDWFGTNTGAITQTGFVMLDDALVPPLPAGLEAFLAEGPAPLLFTPGSFMRGADVFFAQSLAACEALGMRAVFLTPYSEQIPANLPASIRHERYVPLERLTPRAALLVHHGGIGTCAQGMRAGIPQLVSPLFFDQKDNAERLITLGAGEILAREHYAKTALADKMQSLMNSRQVKQNCAQLASLVDHEALARACALVES
jgi:UDP:flavonoid glycosyltransferase YjiC (YdhE family)